MTAATGTSVRHDLGDSLPSTILHYIDGEHVASADNATIPVTDPVGHEEYCTLASGGAADIDRAVAAARRAFLTGPWVGLSARRRSQTLNAIADAIEARADLLAAFESFDTGLPISQAHGLAARARQRTSDSSPTSAGRCTRTRSAPTPRSATRSAGRAALPVSSRRGTCRSCSPRGSSPRASPPAARWC